MNCCTLDTPPAAEARSRLTPRLPAAHPVLAEHERQRCEIWTRVMGYHRPVSSFNVGKQGEFHDRRYFVAEGGAGAGAGVGAGAEGGGGRER